VWGGMHYPSTVAISDTVGSRIARHVNRNSMQRLVESEADRDVPSHCCSRSER
jgi:hypothetical protein